MTDISTYFRRHAWSCEQLEAGIWRSTFATESEEDFDLYVMVADDWVHFAISPFLPHLDEASRSRLYPVLLRLNQELHLARFALDGDGDVNLLADMQLAKLNYPAFAAIVDALALYAGRLAGDLRRVASETGYHSPLFELGE